MADPITVAAVVGAISSAVSVGQQAWKIHEIIQSVYKGIAGDDGLHYATCVWDKVSLSSLLLKMGKDLLQTAKDDDRGARTAHYVNEIGIECGVHAYPRLQATAAIYSAFGNGQRATYNAKQAEAHKGAWESYVEARKAELIKNVAVKNSSGVMAWTLDGDNYAGGDTSKYTVQHWLGVLHDTKVPPSALRIAPHKLEQLAGTIQAQGFITSGAKALTIYTGQWPDLLKLIASGTTYKSMKDTAAEWKAAEQQREMQPARVQAAIDGWLTSNRDEGVVGGTSRPRTLAEMQEIAKDAKVKLGQHPWSQKLEGIPADAVAEWYARYYSGETGRSADRGGSAGILIAAAVALALLGG